MKTPETDAPQAERPTPNAIGPGIIESCGDFNIRIARDGTWYYRNSPIRRLPLVKLFATVLRREADGSYWLVTPAERGRIEVEDAPFVAVELEAEGQDRDQSLTFRTNLDDKVVVGENHPLRVATAPGTDEPRPYVLVRPGLEALLLRPVFYHLIERGEEATVDGTSRFGVWSNGKFFPLDNSTDAI
ncbi:hypothetical protein GCM10011611_11370 [Aliidongia dinghuensis]|uniref:DUF1285 domain-containing protein n=1 Tax=Aliidongia dinghuensis TaxID=1867774 RepID=A0A8J2YR76_9PROT|nr:DUF1285 domain-containing protein [Aliidongia dinghuensis]GGF07635.1 hypothetical protein GCM10011611_11370 [Aliidongia dinghuensis]